jgi:hypothetical protein
MNTRWTYGVARFMQFDTLILGGIGGVLFWKDLECWGLGPIEWSSRMKVSYIYLFQYSST